MITANTTLTHWNYFLALESDVGNLSRYIEFVEDNYSTYSIEIAHLLLATASEIDVVLSQLCSRIKSNKIEGINNYREIIQGYIPEFSQVTVNISRFGLELKPWENWLGNGNPIWWQAYNRVKHKRNNHFSDANLKNVLNAVSGLFISLIFYYRGQVPNNRLFPVPLFLKHLQN